MKAGVVLICFLLGSFSLAAQETDKVEKKKARPARQAQGRAHQKPTPEQIRQFKKLEQQQEKKANP